MYFATRTIFLDLMWPKKSLKCKDNLIKKKKFSQKESIKISDFTNDKKIFYDEYIKEEIKLNI